MAAAAESPAPPTLSPTFEQVQALTLAGEHDLIALHETYIDDTQTPVSAFLKLRDANPGEPAFLLESAEQGRVGRYSFIGVRPRRVLRWSLGDPGDPYELARAELQRWRAPAAVPGLEIPFAGGALGYFAYDLVRTVEPLGVPNPDPLGLPDLALMFTDSLVVFDHLRHTVTVVANVYVTDDEPLADAYARAADQIAELRARLAAPLPVAAPSVPVGARTVPEFASNMSRDEFEAIVARIVRYIHAGDAFQVVPSQRFSAPVEVEAFSIYRGLRAVNPSPYMYFLDFGDFEIAGASPEPLITVAGRRVATRPVAGTRPRGASVEEDERLAAELLADEKERAEHVMLVDLGRNDLGVVCATGTVRVDELMVLERYSHVMHIVSNVVGELRPGEDALDLFAAAFPAGTVTGTPKIRAMQLIDTLEPVRRGFYAGSIAHVHFDGDLDSCISLRSVATVGGRAYWQASAGIVADSEPEAEYAEIFAKTAIVRAVLGLGR